MYTKPQILNVKKASQVILGSKLFKGTDGGQNTSTNTAVRSDE